MPEGYDGQKHATDGGFYHLHDNTVHCDGCGAPQ